MCWLVGIVCLRNVLIVQHVLISNALYVILASIYTRHKADVTEYVLMDITEIMPLNNVLYVWIIVYNVQV